MKPAELKISAMRFMHKERMKTAMFTPFILMQLCRYLDSRELSLAFEAIKQLESQREHLTPLLIL